MAGKRSPAVIKSRRENPIGDRRTSHPPKMSLAPHAGGSHVVRSQSLRVYNGHLPP
jgi:hypothetical protein